ncbi:hypothetical protein RB195_022014 [Necator americanus]|uniref:Uncharacterized protein n=1 Tax=Necator americanus TaxID=51031 RepID=A0ABR1EDX0_NECAM
MGPPVTRSRTLSSDARAVARCRVQILGLLPRFRVQMLGLVLGLHRSVFMTSATERLVRNLQELNDDDNVHGRDAKTLRDSTAFAITEVWNEATSATSSVTKKVDEGASTLLHNIE